MCPVPTALQRASSLRFQNILKQASQTLIMKTQYHENKGFIQTLDSLYFFNLSLLLSKKQNLLR